MISHCIRDQRGIFEKIDELVDHVNELEKEVKMSRDDTAKKMLINMGRLASLPFYSDKEKMQFFYDFLWDLADFYECGSELEQTMQEAKIEKMASKDFGDEE